MKQIKVVTYFLVLITGFACKEVYEPTIISSPNSYLVVEGVLNAGTGATTNIRLTRTFKLDDTARLQAERNAIVVVEGKDNTVHPLSTNGNGLYTSAGLGLVVNKEYRLRIKTADGKEYLSDYVVAIQTPPIDSVGWKQDEKGVQLYVSTHDDSDNTRYYRWDYDETWEIRSYYFSMFKYSNGAVKRRQFPAEYVSTCWKYSFSTNILIGSSASLQSDIIRRAPVNVIGNGDEKLSVRYSILVRQYALDKRGYEFYEMMKKNTESLGTIFDAQPSEMRGNIRCISDPGELVIGYVSATTTDEKRVFISASQLDRWRFSQYCQTDTIRNDPDSLAEAAGDGRLVYDEYFESLSPIPSHYLFSSAPCVDCTERGGSLDRPSYW